MPVVLPQKSYYGSCRILIGLTEVEIAMYYDAESALWKELEEIVRDEGLKLYDLEMLGDILRVSIQKPIGHVTEEHIVSGAVESGASYTEAMSVSAEKPVVSVDSEGGVTLEDCRRLTKRLLFAFRLMEETAGSDAALRSLSRQNFRLEVSSPGLDRHVRLPWHFEQAVNSRVKIQFMAERANVSGDVNNVVNDIPGKKTVVGLLKYCKDGYVGFVEVTKGLEYTVPFDSIRSCRLVY